MTFTGSPPICPPSRTDAEQLFTLTSGPQAILPGPHRRVHIHGRICRVVGFLT